MSQALSVRIQTKRRIYKLMDYNKTEVKNSWYLKEIQEITEYQYGTEKHLKRRTLLDGTKKTIRLF